MRLTIGVDASRAFEHEPTGTECYSLRIIEQLVSRGEHDYVLYTRSRPAAAVPDGATLRLLRPPRLWTHTALALEVARRPPDVLFVPAHVLPAVCRPPAVVTVHDLGHRAYPMAHTRAQRIYLELSTRRHVAVAEHIVVDSEATRRDLMEQYRAPPDRVSVAYLGVDEGMRPVDRGSRLATLRELGLPGDEPYFLHVGTLQPRKNLVRLVTAFARFLDSHPGNLLVLVGRKGWGGEDPVARAAELRIADRVVHLGYVERDQLPALYSGSLATVLPSLYEGFGLTALEAMACRSPVIASSASSVPEVVGDAGLQVDPLDVDEWAAALGRIADDPELRRRLSRLGEARSREFTWSRCADAVLAALESAAHAAMRSAG